LAPAFFGLAAHRRDYLLRTFPYFLHSGWFMGNLLQPFSSSPRKCQRSNVAFSIALVFQGKIVFANSKLLLFFLPPLFLRQMVGKSSPGARQRLFF